MAKLTWFCVLSLAVYSAAVNPGFRIEISAKGFDYVRTVGIPILEKALSSLTIPDISGDADTPVGTIKYTLSNIKLGGLSIPTSSLAPVSGALVLQASGIAIKGSADWKYEEKSWPHISDHGSCDVSVSSVSLNVKVTVGADSNGRPTISANGCSISIGHLDITFHGGASWLYNLFASYIADDLKGSIQDQVCQGAVHAIDTDGNAALQTLPVVIKIDTTSEINFALLSNPIFTSNYVETNHKGEFFSIANATEAPFTPTSLPENTDSSKMLYVWLTEYIADTAAFVYQSSGILAYNITPDMVPSSSPFKLNTKSFELILPQLYKQYPDMAMMLALRVTKPPDLVVVTNSANFTIPGEVNVYVINEKNTTVLAFVLGVVVYADVKVGVHANGTQEIVSFNATFLKADLRLVKSNIGTFSVAVLQAATDLLSKAVVVPALNRYGNKGIPLPIVDGMSFVKPMISLGQGYVLVSTDFNYNPTKRLQ